MSAKDRTTTRTALPITLLLLVVLAALVFAVITFPEREKDLASGSLERAGREARVKLDAVIKGYETDLEEEASFIHAHDSLADDVALLRWTTVMNAHWPIRSVHLADEAGRELALVRGDSGWAVERAPRRDSTAFPPGLIDQPALAVDPPVAHDSLHDPRTEDWFVGALKDRSGSVVWSATGPDGRFLQASLLLRGPGPERYQVLAFELDSRELFNSAMEHQPKEQAHLVVNVDGEPLMTRADTGSLHAMMDQLLGVWKAEPNQHILQMEEDGMPYFGQVTPYPLTGETLELATVINGRRIHGWLAPIRWALHGGLVLWAVLAVLLVLARKRLKASTERLRKQEKQNRTQQRRLAKAIGERDVLDREVHHRVKNNLQVVSSLLNLQAMRIPEGPTREEFRRGKLRIDHMAMVHKKLYAAPDLRNIALNNLFTDLANELHTAHLPQSRGISIAVDTAGIISDPDTAIELGIILCELLENSLVHAFPYATGGHVDIRARHIAGDEHELEVVDNGTGMKGTTRNETQLGLEIVDALAQQLDGTLDVRSGAGLSCKVRFRMLHPVG
ncbi:MAG: sensor histidine kinase [Flavobacteriales bacterium]|nr:sensor histidine kinase [Flavobacteriales bacterium]